MDEFWHRLLVSLIRFTLVLGGFALSLYLIVRLILVPLAETILGSAPLVILLGAAFWLMLRRPRRR